MAMSQERKGTIAVSLTNFLDSGCIVASSVALTAWAAAFGFGSMWTSILGAIGANAFGAAIGALIGGFLTDKYGRTIIYRYNLLVYAIGVAIAMCAMNLPMVVVGVVLSGLSVGAGVPASWSYISETSTSTKRAANIGISQFAWSCGPAIIFLLSLALSFALPGFAADGKTLLPAGPTVPSTACCPRAFCSWCCSWWPLSHGICSASCRSPRIGRRSRAKRLSTSRSAA